LPIQISLYFLACAASMREQPVRAARLWGAVEGMEEAYGVHVSPIALSESDYEGRLAASRSQLDERAWSRAWEEGKAMLLERAVDYGLSEEEELEPSPLAPATESPLADEPTETLTRREQEVALLVARGLTNRQIAQELSVSRNTANNHVARILRKLGLSSRSQIAAWVTERNFPSS
jgi:DNA-binding NarL/FixJ family response regulator